MENNFNMDERKNSLIQTASEPNEQKVTIGGTLWAERIFFLLVMLFSLCCLKLCAEDAFITPAQAKESREKFVSASKQYIGCPYVYGAVGPDSFDCSGLIYYVARESVKVQLPRTAKAIYNYCKIVDDDEREAGDLLFFKTTSSGTISHVGIYIGNKQFISAISDGPNTGVIVSSLNQDYWKSRYVCTGQFLKSGRSKGEPLEEELKGDSGTELAAAGGSKKTGTGKAERTKSGSGSTAFKDSLKFDAGIQGGWSFLTPEKVAFNFKGVDATVNVKYSAWALEPGLGFVLRYNHQNKMFQIPVVLSFNANDYIKFYAGPVFSFGSGILKGTEEKEIKASIFPGILGMEFSTPGIKAGKTKISFVQDVSYSFFNNPDNSALSFKESFGNGLNFSTGIKVTFPLSAVL